MQYSTSQFELQMELSDSPTFISAEDGPLFLRLGPVVERLRLDGKGAIIEDPSDPSVLFEHLRLGTELVIGRCAVEGGDTTALRRSLPDTVSRSHAGAMIGKFSDGFKFLLRDLGSRNGSSVVVPKHPDRVNTSIPAFQEDLRVGRHGREYFIEVVDSGMSSAAAEYRPLVNQDACFISGDNEVFAVLDGVGGACDGGDASHLASKRLNEWALASKKSRDLEVSDTVAMERIEEIIGHVNQELMTNYRGLGQTTLTMGVKLYDGRLLVANVGDSRRYVFRDGELLHITVDNEKNGLHISLPSMGETVEQRALSEMMYTADNPDDFLRFKYKTRNRIYNCLGSGDPETSFTIFRPQPKDVVVLTTDGVHDNLTNSQITGTLKAMPGVPATILARSLVSRAQEFSRRKPVKGKMTRPKPDDMTALVVKY